MGPSGTTVIHVVADSREASRSVADVSFIAPVASCCLQVLEEVQRHRGPAHRELPAAPAPLRLSLDGPLSPAFVFRSLASRLPPESVVVEESPSSGPLLRTLVPARAPGSRFSAAGGGLGFAMPAAVGLRMGDPTRPTVCVVGDGSSLYSIQSLWSAAQYGVGVLFIVLANGRYAIMDRLVAAHSPGATAPWPSFPEISIHTLAHGLGCASRQIRSRTELAVALDEIVPTLDARTSPLLLDVAVDEAD
jgi:benzoylformate decarboxylase